MSETPTADGRPDEAAAAEARHALSYPCGEPPAPGQVKPVAPGVLWLRMPLPFSLNHINLWALADEDELGQGWARAGPSSTPASRQPMCWPPGGC